MDAIQEKVNIINRLTAYTGIIINEQNRKMIELTHSSGLNKWILSSPNEHMLLNKLNNFLHNRLNGKITTNSVDKLV